MKNLQCFVISVIVFGSCIGSDSLLSLPHPYNTIESVLPFDNHGWYFNAVWIEKLMKANRIEQVVEVGSWLGSSTRHIASLLPDNGKLYAVDIWEESIEYTEGNPWVEYTTKVSTAYQQFLSNVIHVGLTDKIVPIKSRSLAAVSVLQNINDRFDLIYIDAAHDTESVYNDMTAYFPFVNGHKGILCGDDWSWESVRIAVLKFAQEQNLTVYTGGNFWFLAEEETFGLHSFVDASDAIWKFPKK